MQPVREALGGATVVINHRTYRLVDDSRHDKITKLCSTIA